MSELTAALDSAKRLKLAEDDPNLVEANEQMRWEIKPHPYTERDSLFLSIAGSGTTVEDYRDWLQNFSVVWMKKISERRKYKGTLGYVNGAENCIDALWGVDEIRKFDGEWYIDGHSKGGPQAKYVAMKLRDEFSIKVRGVRTFGEPMNVRRNIPDPLFQNCHRWACAGDPIPSWPFNIPVLSNVRGKWRHQGIHHELGVGLENDEHWGVVRDAIENHLIGHTIYCLERLIGT